MAFPASPTNGQKYTDPSGRVWSYTTATTKWETVGSPVTKKTSTTTAPTASSDSTLGYSVGSIWTDTTNSKTYVCTNATAAAAVWVVVSDGLFTQLSTDPSLPTAGQVWYNTTTKQFHGSDGVSSGTAGAWTTMSPLTTARGDLAGAGVSSSALSFGGYTTTYVGTTELYNGTSWATKSPLTTARGYPAGAGTSSSALSFGGYTTTYVGTTELYNGTSWATQSAMTTARDYLAGAGASSSALSFGGYTTTYVGTTELYNGTSWATKSPLTTARGYLAGAGASSSALSFGGYTTTYVGTTELYGTISHPNIFSLV